MRVSTLMTKNKTCQHRNLETVAPGCFWPLVIPWFQKVNAVICFQLPAHVHRLARARHDSSGFLPILVSSMRGLPGVPPKIEYII